MKFESGSIELVSNWLQDKVNKYRPKSLFLPAGRSLVPIYQEWSDDEPEFLNGLSLFQLDEVLVPSRPFAQFFIEKLPGLSVQPPENRIDSADLTILGLGENGHVAFHEPHVAPDFEYGEVTLANSTLRNLGLPEGTKGLTYGLGTFLKSKAILLVVSGENKSSAFNSFMESDPTVPATWLRGATDFTVLEVSSN